ncbi:hypothetical protein CPB86DRAFT_801713 [Serendipita vermifera]|nr:hypothetical protein CPB86DRAFT_801713 [Serendipita vermifera]
MQRLRVAVDQFQAEKAIHSKHLHDQVLGPICLDESILERYVREHALQILGLDPKISSSEWLLPETTTSLLPDKHTSLREELRIDWDQNGLTPWTKHIAVIFEARFLQEQRLGSFPLLVGAIRPGSVARIFIKSVLNWKATYARLYISRKRRVNSNGLPDDALQTLELLGAEGMSSADSEGEETEHDHYLVKLHPWRAPTLTAWKRPRIPSEKVSETRDPPSGLPESFYSQEWLLLRSEWAKEKLAVLTMEWTLPDI